MSKQVNLSLAVARDVAVLRNGEKYQIERIEPLQDKDYQINIVLPKNAYLTPFSQIAYTKTGAYWLDTKDGKDIIDVLRNGASIFEQSK